jgi:putative redox-active protein with C_GCAxxG_C_C motif
MNEATKQKQPSPKKLFIKFGTCSHTFFHILNREFNNPKVTEEKSADLLAGGILQKGYQCGMLWGASLAVGTESAKNNQDQGDATAKAIVATQKIIESFVDRTKSPDCLEITNCDWTSKLSMAKHMLSGKFLSCYKLADHWAPEAIEAANKGLAEEFPQFEHEPKSCASEALKAMGASEEESQTVAGFAGGLGLSGNACGALAATIWYRRLEWYRQNTGKSTMNQAETTAILEAFQKETKYEFLCKNISEKCFASIDEHSEYINSGGCSKLIKVLAEA